MITNNLKIAFRNLRKNRLFSAINIFGLASAMSLGMFILLLAQDARSYDRFHPDGDRIFRVTTEAVRKNGDSEKYASTPCPLGEAVGQSSPAVAEAVRISERSFGEAKANGKILAANGFFAEPSFLSVFGFELLDGHAATALNEPFSIILSKKCAENYFPRQSAIGQMMEIRGYGPFKITGVLAEPKGKSHLEMDVLAAFSTLASSPDDAAMLRDWNNYYQTHTYLKLREGAETASVEAALAAISKAEFDGKPLESRDDGYRFGLQKLSAITPGPIMSNNLGKGIPAILLLFLSILAAVVLLSACFNYTNLTLARSLARAREMGVRKTMGATRRQLFGQLIGESTAAALVALVVGFGLMKMMQPAFNRLSFTEFIDVQIRENWATIGLFLAFGLLTGVLAGALPALAMSKISPTAALQKLQNVRFFKRIGLRKALLVGQFAVSMVFIFLVTAIARQIRFAAELDYGFRTEQIVNVDLQGERLEKVAPALGSLAFVERVSAVSFEMGTFRDGSIDVKATAAAEPEAVRDYSVDHLFLENMGLTLLAGANFFEKKGDSTLGSMVIVNERFLEKYALGSPAEAIGKPLVLGENRAVSIGGVVKNFLFKPAEYALEPLVLRNDPADWGILQVKIAASASPTEAMAALERAWSQAVPERKIRAEFYSETIRANFSTLRDVLAVVSVFAFLGILIAAFGLLGMATYAVETRVKEIGLRKTLGASNGDLVRLLSGSFFKVLGVAALIALPLGWFLGSQFLGLFAHRIGLGASVFLPGLLLVFGIGAISVGSQTVRAALADPVKSLRSE